MNLYLLSFFLRMADGTIRGGTQTVQADFAIMALLQLGELPLPGVIVGPVTWSLIGAARAA